jgi:hypothetical protein
VKCETCVTYFTQRRSREHASDHRRRLWVGPESPSPTRLLRARHKRPSRRRAAEQRDELAPFHCPMPPVLPIKRIAHLSKQGDCCTAGVRAGLCRLGGQQQPSQLATAPMNLFRLDATNAWEITDKTRSKQKTQRKLRQGRNITLCIDTSFCAARLCSGPLRR